MLSSLQPALRRWWLTTQRAQAFHNLEKRRQSRVIGLIHRQETMAFLGFPVARYIDIDDSEAVLERCTLRPSNAPRRVRADAVSQPPRAAAITWAKRRRESRL